MTKILKFDNYYLHYNLFYISGKEAEIWITTRNFTKPFSTRQSAEAFTQSITPWITILIFQAIKHKFSATCFPLRLTELTRMDTALQPEKECPKTWTSRCPPLTKIWGSSWKESSFVKPPPPAETIPSLCTASTWTLPTSSTRSKRRQSLKSSSRQRHKSEKPQW